MRNTKETAEIVEQVSLSVMKEVNHKREMGIYDTAQLPGIIYANCKEHNCTKLFEHILKILRDR